MKMKQSRETQTHVLLLPYPAQGHINPLIQFGKRLASYDLRVTLANTRYLSAGKAELSSGGPISFATYSDGFDSGGQGAAPSIRAYLDSLESVGSETLAQLIESLDLEGRPVHVIVYDPFLPWAREVGKRLGLRTAALFTQCCAVDMLYRHMWEGTLKLPVTEALQLPGLPRLELTDIPSFISSPDTYPDYLTLLVNQNKGLDKADMVLINSIYELEKEEFDWMKSKFPVKSVGPMLPSKYLDNRIPSDSHYGFNIYTPDTSPYLTWLDSKPPSSVIYVSFGSMVSLTTEQTIAVASALKSSNKPFFWVVRATESSRLPKGFSEDNAGQGLVVTWCNQLDVLAHGAVGCFLTHCGWNSLTEGLVFGVPMVGMPQWSDQPTGAKYIEDVWKNGVRVRGDEVGFVSGEELERCIRIVMDGERSADIKSNAMKWKEVVKNAASEGGSSDKCILEFIEECCK